MTKQQIKPVTIRIDVELWREVEIAAVLMGLSKRAFTESALREKLEREKDD